VFSACVLVATTDERLRQSVASIFSEMSCEVLTADGGTDCLVKLRAKSPDLLVVLPPLLWGSVADVLTIVREEPATRDVPILVLNPAPDAVFPRVPRLFAPDTPDKPSPVTALVERACSWARQRGAMIARSDHKTGRPAASVIAAP
jgi:DNA-binding response OmpR family regulator